MLDEPAILPEDPEELRSFTVRLIVTLRHPLAGTGHTGSGPRRRRSNAASGLELSEIAAATITPGNVRHSMDGLPSRFHLTAFSRRAG
ncbi:hypothetical protein GI374_14235 [Paracoccus sp. S-4012]|uniref:hypothetical protein n=1 Tax=Paracoccus sp. S-4012 TaxID=2665648 RepID=UPI0012AF2358|nr:hypothetical protein [Paracoccus sp. S-4012]MRX51574.1 hypothetical protein [Paracoccus sp. S-4012]